MESNSTQTGGEQRYGVLRTPYCVSDRPEPPRKQKQQMLRREQRNKELRVNHCLEAALQPTATTKRELNYVLYSSSSSTGALNFLLGSVPALIRSDPECGESLAIG